MKRLLDPLGLVLKAGVWYLVALSGRTRSLRTFRVSRVLSVKPLDEECLRPDDFDLATHWAEAPGRVPRQPGRPCRCACACTATRCGWCATCRIPPAGSPRSTSASEPDAEGWVTLTLQFENHDVAGYELMRLAGDVEVLEPVELRQTMVERGASMVALCRRASLTECRSPTRSSASTAGAPATAAGGAPGARAEAGDVVTYRCVDCADMWYLEVTEDDLEV